MRREHSLWLVPACVASFLALAGVGVSRSGEEDPAVRLERAIQLETVDGDLRGAVVLYEQIIAGRDSNATVAARALYRLGWCHEMLGNQEARTAYRRLIDEYPGQKNEVALARARLAALDAAAKASAKPLSARSASRPIQETESCRPTAGDSPSSRRGVCGLFRSPGTCSPTSRGNPSG